MTTAANEHMDASANEVKATSVKSATAAVVTTAAQSPEDPGWCALDISFIASGETMLVRAVCCIYMCCICMRKDACTHAVCRLNSACMLQQLGKQDMSAAWRLFLFGNGSPTHHLGLLTGFPTEVDVIGLHAIGTSLDDAPGDMSAIATPRCRRQVWLRNSNGERLGYATSWLHEADVGAVFKNQKIPIGKNIMQNRTELFRDMKSVYCGSNAALEVAFGHAGPFWGRSYLFWNGGRPVAFIYEVFSPALEKYMGEVLIE